MFDEIGEYFEDFEFNPVALLLALVFGGVLFWAFFHSPDQETIDKIPFVYRAGSLVVAVIGGYFFGDWLLNK